MAENAVRWFEIYVQDMNRSKKFYESVFETQLEKLNSPDLEMWSFRASPDRMGAGGALVKMAGVASGGNSTIVYFRCTDCAVETARAVKSGGKIHKEKFAIGEYGFIALVYDTEGNMLGLHSMQ